MRLCLGAELHMPPPTGFPFQRKPAASVVEGERATKVWDSALLTCVARCTLYLFSFDMRSLRTLRSERREVGSGSLGCGMATFPCLPHHCHRSSQGLILTPAGSTRRVAQCHQWKVPIHIFYTSPFQSRLVNFPCFQGLGLVFPSGLFGVACES